MDVDVEDIKKHGALTACVIAWFNKNIGYEWSVLKLQTIADEFCVSERCVRSKIHHIVNEKIVDRKITTEFNHAEKKLKGTVSYYRLGRGNEKNDYRL